MVEITPELLAQAIALLQSEGKLPKAVAPDKKAAMLSAKDKALLTQFKRRGFKDVVLINRADPSAPFNVRPFQGWINQGRIVRKGERGVRGLFHVSQTDPIEAAPKAPKEGKPVEAKPAEAPKPTGVFAGVDPAAIAAAVAKLKAQSETPKGNGHAA